MASTRSRLLASAATALALLAAGGSSAAAADRPQSTQLISRSLSGGVPNGASTHAVISDDKRYARVIAFESEASNLVSGDTNGVKDVFAVRRSGRVGNDGARWQIGKTVLISRSASGAPANGPSFGAAVDGAFHRRPSCVAFLSSATNLVRGDTNGRVDAFVRRLRGSRPRRLSLPRGRQSGADTSAVAVSGDCKVIAWTTGGVLYVSKRGHTKRVATGAADPSFSTGLRDDLVYGASAGVYLAKGGTGRPRLIAPGGRNPAYTDIKRRVVAYEKTFGGHVQIGYRDVGRAEQVISSRYSSVGNGDSRAPVIGNAGYYVTFETDASNLGV
ncbi:MAG: hypothetical protein QOJ07_3876, partial [Thermoleophilaceae bacterium]|nr:hypothetical protein [Thermoleophilaceae bacterium]